MNGPDDLESSGWDDFVQIDFVQSNFVQNNFVQIDFVPKELRPKPISSKISESIDPIQTPKCVRGFART